MAPKLYFYIRATDDNVCFSVDGIWDIVNVNFFKLDYLSFQTSYGYILQCNVDKLGLCLW